MSLAGSSGTGYSGSAFSPSSVGRIFAVPSRDSNLPSQNYLDARSNQAGKAFQQNPSIYSGGSSGTGHSPASYNGFTGRTSARSRVSGSHSGISGSQSRRSPSVEVLKRPSPATLQLLHQAGIARTRSTTLGRLTMISTLLGGEDTEEYI
ncbi:hypothetical protein ISN45_Aa07g028890 [Arabidopsis thaliana x Arabidopsis arenosa]|uniref:Uncharacterized protein n=1 Tax=Arabidopsis thaliana x Arabidopsis arenosa TaxID=1240361 RepID=A0A8T1YCF7_9BRAS|nr:hypothetical protein ISN45_Aa07g028890 [Arabidopsis thaliana x Arabidopsis arenosa]